MTTRMRIPAIWMAALAGLCAARGAAAAPRTPPDCRAGPARAETLEDIDRRGELRLGSGARAVLDSLRWPDADETAAAWLTNLRGSRLVVVPRGTPDRWGRERVDAQVDGSDIDLAGGLIGAGLALADANEADVLCRPALRAVEAAARAGRLGLWQAPGPAVDDGPALRALAGRFAVVEGVVRHVGERSTRTYLDFVARGADGLTVTVPKRTWRTMASRGLSALAGRRVRVRGVVELWRGPVIEAASVDAVEILDGALPDGTPAAPSDASDRGEQGLRR
jgi:hypothetical protein